MAGGPPTSKNWSSGVRQRASGNMQPEPSIMEKKGARLCWRAGLPRSAGSRSPTGEGSGRDSIRAVWVCAAGVVAGGGPAPGSDRVGALWAELGGLWHGAACGLH